MARSARTLLALTTLALLAFPHARSAVAAAPATQPALDYALVITGAELLSGAYADAHTHYITRTLRPLGFHCVGSIMVDDRTEDIVQAMRFFQRNTKLIIVTGGLGPTDSDVVRESLTAFTGIALREHADAIAEMEKRYNTPRDQLRANLRRQAVAPEGGTYLKNATGTATGLVFDRGESLVVALPGPPRELQPMVLNELVPYLSKRLGTRLPGASLTVRFVGIGQSQITQTLHERVPLDPDIVQSTQFDAMRVDFTFALPADTPEAQARLRKLGERIVEHLGDGIYALDETTTLEEHVEQRLAARRATIAIAEAGSGGALSGGLNGAASATRVLAGAIIAPTEDGLGRLLSIDGQAWTNTPPPGRLPLLAAAAARHCRADWSIAVGEPRRDDQGRYVVNAVIRRPDGTTQSHAVAWRGAGDAARAAIATQVLDLLRRQLR